MVLAQVNLAHHNGHNIEVLTIHDKSKDQRCTKIKEAKRKNIFSLHLPLGKTSEIILCIDNENLKCNTVLDNQNRQNSKNIRFLSALR